MQFHFQPDEGSVQQAKNNKKNLKEKKRAKEAGEFAPTWIKSNKSLLKKLVQKKRLKN